MADSISILGVRLSNLSGDELLCRIGDMLDGGRQVRIFYANAHVLNIACEQPSFREVLEGADFIYPDGIGVELAAALFGERIKENLNGTDFIPRLLEWCERRGASVYLLGSKADVVSRAAERMKVRYPRLEVLGFHHGYFDPTADDVANEIRSLRPSVVLVGMGSPRQELWISRNSTALLASVLISVGAFFDHYSGAVRRAPLWIRKARLEWLFRLSLEPRRLFRRYVIGNPLFLVRIFKAYVLQRIRRPKSSSASP